MTEPEECEYSLEQLEYDEQCKIESAWDYGDDYYEDEDKLEDARTTRCLYVNPEEPPF